MASALVLALIARLVARIRNHVHLRQFGNRTSALGLAYPRTEFLACLHYSEQRINTTGWEYDVAGNQTRGSPTIR